MLRPDSFVTWRASLKASAKTKKEYQISLNAFLNWLERLGESRGIRSQGSTPSKRGENRFGSYRAFTEEELARLFAIAGKRLLAYQMLLYTGQRKSEVRALVWGDLNLDSAEPYVLFRESTMKDKDKRSVALQQEIARTTAGHSAAKRRSHKAGVLVLLADVTTFCAVI